MLLFIHKKGFNSFDRKTENIVSVGLHDRQTDRQTGRREEG